jgi:hypothetical protein
MTSKWVFYLHTRQVPPGIARTITIPVHIARIPYRSPNYRRMDPGYQSRCFMPNFLALLKIIHQKNMGMGLSWITTPSQVCEDFVISKQHLNELPQGKSWRVKKPLEIVRFDIYRLVTPFFYRGKRYIITFIDDYSWKICVYFLQEKSKTFEG